MKRKASVMPPPVDLSAVARGARPREVERDGTALFVETRDADDRRCSTRPWRSSRERKETFRLITVGPVDGLGRHDVPRADRCRETDDAAHARGMCEAGVIVSVKPDAASDFLVVRGLAAGCRPVLPDVGVLPGAIARRLQQPCLYDMSPGALADHLQAALSPFQLAGRMDERPQDARAVRPGDRVQADRRAASRSWCGCERWIEASRTDVRAATAPRVTA